MSDRVCHGSEDADGRGEHDDVGELEHRFGKAFGEGQHGAALGLRDEREGHGKQNAEDDDLQHLAFGDGFGDVFRKDVGNELRCGVRRWFQRFGGDRGQAHAFSGAADVDGGEANQQSEGADDFEINEGFYAEAANFFEVRVAGDADDERDEEQRGDDYLDETQEDGAEELKLEGDRGGVVAKFRDGEQAKENPRG